MAVPSGTPCTQQSHHALQDHQWDCCHPCCSSLPVSLTRPDQRPPPTIQTTTLQNSHISTQFLPKCGLPKCLWNALPAKVVLAPSPETFHLAPCTHSLLITRWEAFYLHLSLFYFNALITVCSCNRTFLRGNPYRPITEKGPIDRLLKRVR